MIKGVLETAIQSDLPGMVRASTSEDVYSFDGRRVLIPKGTMHCFRRRIRSGGGCALLKRMIEDAYTHRPDISDH
jgi:hypothetical protein